METPETERDPKAVSDHDLLIRLDQKVTSFLNDFNEFKKNSKEEVNKKLDDHEKRIRFMERYFWVAIGGLALIQILIPIILHFFS